jgi:hypothetical protein
MLQHRNIHKANISAFFTNFYEMRRLGGEFHLASLVL